MQTLSDQVTQSKGSLNVHGRTERLKKPFGDNFKEVAEKTLERKGGIR